MDDHGSVGILNVGAGDTKLTFDPKDPAECVRAARIVKDMLRRGYALMVEVTRRGKREWVRALDFDEAHHAYVIADLDPVAAATADGEEAAQPADSVYRTESGLCACGCGQQVEDGKTWRRGHSARKRRRVPASGTRAVAVARSAGG